MSERTTTIVSALVALAILGLGVTAQPAADPAVGRLQSLESDVRFQIAMSWRHDERTRDAREAQLVETLTAWKGSPQSAADRQLLEQWLRGAIVGSMPGESGEFPPTPTFSAPADEMEQALKVRPDATNQPSVAGTSELKSPLPPVAAKSETTSGEAKLPPLPRDVKLKPGQAYTPPLAKEFRITPRSRGAEQTAPTEQQAMKPQATPAAPRVASPPQRVIAAKPVDVPPMLPTQNLAVEPAKREPAPRLAEATPKRNPSEERPAPDVETWPPRASREATERNMHDDEVTPHAPRVMVNLAELNAQIRGYHDGLDEIEATVVSRRGNLTEGQVAKLVSQLEQLAGQYQFIRLYYDGLTPRERRLVKTPRRLAETITLVDAERAALVAQDEDFLTVLEEAVAEDELARRLKTLAEENDATPSAESHNKSAQ